MRQESGLEMIEDDVLICYVLGAILVLVLLYSGDADDGTRRFVTMNQYNQDAVWNSAQAFES